jgi:hypothetical protein
MTLQEELVLAAKRAVEVQPRHSSETLFELLLQWYGKEKELTQEDFEAAVEKAL